MSHSIEFMQHTLKIDGALCNVIMPDDAEQLLVAMLPGFFEDGKINVYKLPADVKAVKYSELEQT